MADELDDIVLRLRPGHDSVPSIVRLRRLLKLLWRGYRMKCIEIDGVPRAQQIGRLGQRNERRPASPA